MPCLMPQRQAGRELDVRENANEGSEGAWHIEGKRSRIATTMEEGCTTHGRRLGAAVLPLAVEQWLINSVRRGLLSHAALSAEPPLWPDGDPRSDALSALPDQQRS